MLHIADPCAGRLYSTGTLDVNVTGGHNSPVDMSILLFIPINLPDMIREKGFPINSTASL